ncbi:MAG: DNA-directed RNA polymerase subunit alpha [Candidatus Nomurabacteria bacterium]|jgi:DNA-directed RNA polymerase subunit alpha|nr:DNA-directed RNA polymerase subunit alpha [Candidatus Nomurabacteria bacterium]
MAKTIHNPMLKEVIDHDKNSATFIVRPLYPGYGHTLGNSLRRVLLSSVAGASIVAFKIDGITHEYSAIEGVKEDVVDIMLNLKRVHFKSHTDIPVEVHIEKKGAGELTAGDIKLPAELEISNPEQLIATIDDAKKTFVLDIVVDSGRGYQTIEKSSTERIHSDMIAIDAIFTPVLRCRFKVESDRVGQDTDLQQLQLTIETDGTITPREAFEEAAAILINQYQALAGSTVVEAAPTPGIEEDDIANGLMTQIEDLGFSARTTNALINNQIHTVRDLVTLSDQDFKELKGFGAKALEEVKTKLKELSI